MSGLSKNNTSVFFLLLTLFFTQFGLAQEDVKTTKFKVSDLSGDVLIGASIIVVENGKEIGGVTDLLGEFKIDLHSSSTYTISYVGFLEKRGSVNPGQELHVILEQNEIELSEVVVTSQFKPTLVESSIQDVRIISKDEIAAKGSSNLKDVLNSSSNFSFSESDIYGSNIQIGGLGGANVKFLINGVPVSGRLNNEIDINQILLSDVERIEIIEGPQSAIYGNNAMAGVINIITKTKSALPSRLELNALYESTGKYDLDGAYSTNLKGHSMGISFGRYFFSGFSTDDNSRDLDWNPKEQYFGNAYYSKIIKRTELTLSGRVFREKILNRYNPATPFASIALDDHFKTSRQQYLAEFKNSFKPGHVLSGAVSYSYYKRIKNTYIKNLINLEETISPSSSDQDTNKIQNYFGTTSYSFETNSGDLSLLNGIQSEHERFKGERIQDEAQYITDLAYYTSLKWRVFNEKLEIQPSLRFIYNSKYVAPVIPAFYLKYTFDKIDFRASYSRGFRAPSIKELYLYFVDVNHNIRGNENLKAENGHYLNVSINAKKGFKRQMLSGELTASYSTIHDKIELVLSDPNTTEYTYRNFETFQSWNSRAGIQYHNKSLRLENSVNTVWIQVGQMGNDPSKLDPFLQFSSNASYTITRFGLDVSASYKYNGKRDSYYIDSESGDIYSFTIEDYHWLEVSAGKSFFEEKLRLTIGGRNLFNVKDVKSNATINGIHSPNNEYTPVGTGISIFTKLKINI
ncbi:MAG: TonB-dependent receptor [Chitinophagales bacterium]|nr:TonB-dependent receptor [Chitinophagales bacterium]